MFPTRYFANRMFAPRYFPKVGDNPPVGSGGGSLALIGAGHNER